MSLRDALASNHRALVAMTTPDLKRVKSVLQALRDKLAEGLTAQTKKTAHQAHVHAAKMIQLDKALAQAQKQLRPAVKATLAEQSAKFSRRALDNLRRVAEEGERRFGGISSSLRLPQASVLADVGRSVSARHAGSAARYAGDVGRVFHRQMAMGLISGESVDDIAKRLVGRRVNAPADAIADRVAEMSLNDATRLVRTELNGAYAQAELAGIRSMNAQESDDGGERPPGQSGGDDEWWKMWDATLDHRTCMDCRALHGEVARVDSPFSGGIFAPPLHPNDRCGIVPWRRSWPRNMLEVN